jgi:hypothetical protein
MTTSSNTFILTDKKGFTNEEYENINSVVYVKGFFLFF